MIKPRVRKSELTYRKVRDQAIELLKKYPEIQGITLRRPPEPVKPLTYASGNLESFGRMPETCPVVRSILEKHLTDEIRIIGADEKIFSARRLRDLIFSDILSQVTEKFRYHLSSVSNDKHRALQTLKSLQKQITDSIERIETPIAVNPPASAEPTVFAIEVNPDEEEEENHE